MTVGSSKECLNFFTKNSGHFQATMDFLEEALIYLVVHGPEKDDWRVRDGKEPQKCIIVKLSK